MRLELVRALVAPAIAAGFGLLVATAAFAADYTLTLSAEEVNYIGNVLQQQPYKDVATLLAKLQAQVNKQNADAAKVVPPPAPEKPNGEVNK